MLNSSLIDVSTGERAYEIVTTLVLPDSETNADSGDLGSSIPDVTSKERRHTRMTDFAGNTLVSIAWNGRQPDIIILGEKVGGLTNLFGSSTVRFMPKILLVPTRFDTEYIWTATANSLTLFDYDSETTKGTFYQNVIRVPTTFKLRPKPVAPSTSYASRCLPVASPSSPSSSSSLSSCSLPSSPSSSSPVPSLVSSASSSPPSASSVRIPSCASSPTHTETPKSSFFPTHLPGVGNNYLEFSRHPLAHDVEIIVSFLMMEILRRGRFVLTPYTFEKPKLWQLKETRDLVFRRLRGYTV
ncbi:hypothetical protein LshimejAT787_0202510 [Lyophyllum shimeji]|uniref:Uncharacterized protein n=1 Tax=Lyophyllum shimeji TaxID=47721 RepID=A0A9P3PF27_LYOSH|nr:hypothetical protein LshimejAT787_0202510 [Lyophyllum shimeji]